MENIYVKVQAWSLYILKATEMMTNDSIVDFWHRVIVGWNFRGFSNRIRKN